jgi:hypothetical protein
VLEGRRETLGNLHPHTLMSVSNLGLLLHKKGDLAAAEPLYREVLEVVEARAAHGRHPHMLMSVSNLYNLGKLLQDKGDFAAAEPLLREVGEGARATIGDRHPRDITSIDIHNLGVLLLAKGDGLA